MDCWKEGWGDDGMVRMGKLKASSRQAIKHPTRQVGPRFVSEPPHLQLPKSFALHMSTDYAYMLACSAALFSSATLCALIVQHMRSSFASLCTLIFNTRAHSRRRFDIRPLAI